MNGKSCHPASAPWDAARGRARLARASLPSASSSTISACKRSQGHDRILVALLAPPITVAGVHPVSGLLVLAATEMIQRLLAGNTLGGLLDFWTSGLLGFWAS
jgi:hypothetical protein